MGTPHPAPRSPPTAILWRLITGEQGALVRQIGLADSQLTHIGRAIRWIRDHHTETLRIEDLARLAGMGASPFHRHFRAEDVADVGFAVGYDSASQFSCDSPVNEPSEPANPSTFLIGGWATPVVHEPFLRAATPSDRSTPASPA